MKLEEIPQDHDPSFAGQKKLCYAVDDAGRFVRAQTSGWEVEAAVKDLAWQAIHRDLAQARSDVAEGLASRLTYYMKWRLMDEALLAGNVGVSRWRLRRHLRPARFARLSEAWIERYAKILDIAPEALRAGELPEAPGVAP